jgi:hypothetical protein
MRITGEDKVASFGRLVAKRTALERHLIGKLAVVKLSEAPTVVEAYLLESLTMN